MEETTAIMEPEPEGDFESVSQKMRDISQQFSSSQNNQSFSSVQENICSYVRYKDWLENLKQAQSGLINSVTDQTTSEGESDREDLTTRIAVLQEELLKETSDHAIKELIVRSAQLGHTLQHLLFSQQPETDNQREEKENTSPSWAHKLCEKQRVVSTDILAHHQACQSLQDEIEQSKKQIRDMQAANVELMKRLQAKEIEENNPAPSKSLQKEQEKLDKHITHVTMEKGILQGLIIGSGVNWAKDPDLKDLVIGLGQPLKLD